MKFKYFFPKPDFYLGKTALLVFLILFSFSMFPEPNKEPVLPAKAGKIKIMVENANVRQQPNLTSKILLVLKKDDQATVLKTENQWLKIYFQDSQKKDIIGYIHSSVVQEITKITPPPADPVEPAETEAIEKTEPPPAEPIREKPKTNFTGSATTLARDLKKLKALDHSIKKESIAFLTLIKEMKPQIKAGNALSTTEKAKVISTQAAVYQTDHPNSLILYRPLLNEEFVLLSKRDEYFRIILKDGREGWIHENNVQLYMDQEHASQIVFQSIKPAEYKKYADVALSLFNHLIVEVNVSRQIYSSYTGYAAESNESLQELFTMMEKIETNFKYAAYFYKTYFEKQMFSTKESWQASLSAWAELLLGSSSYESIDANAVGSKENSQTRKINLGGAFDLNPQHSINMNLQTNKEIIQTPFAATDVSMGHHFHPNSGFNLNSQITFCKYTDYNLDINNFNRISVNTTGNYQLNQTFGLNLNYGFTGNSFQTNHENNYSNHQLFFSGKLKTKASQELEMKLFFNLGNSDSIYQQFIHLNPELDYQITSQNKSIHFIAGYETLSYKELEIQTFTSMKLAFKSILMKKSAYNYFDLGLKIKNFPNNTAISYVQLQTAYQLQKVSGNQKNFITSFHSRFYANTSTYNYSDFKMNYLRNSAMLSQSFSTYCRFWHQAEDNANSISKSHIFDLNGKLGIRVKHLTFGPAAGLHTALSFAKGTEFFKRDGNLFCFGAFLEGTIPFSKGIRLTLQGLYDYGFVYNSQITIDPVTAEIFESGIEQRHPTTLQIFSDLSIPLFSQFVVVGQFHYYKIKTDMNPAISMNPLMENNHFALLGGIRYRYN